MECMNRSELKWINMHAKQMQKEHIFRIPQAAGCPGRTASFLEAARTQCSKIITTGDNGANAIQS